MATQTHDPDAPGTEDPEAGARAAVAAVRNGSKAPDDLRDATAWFLSEQDAGVLATKDIEIDVGATQEHYVVWKVQAIPRERIRQIRNQSRVKRGRGLADEVNDTKANLMIAAEGTVVPDLEAIRQQIGASDTPSVLDARMRHKPGLIDQIANTVLEVSGYDDDDVRDVAAVRG